MTTPCVIYARFSTDKQRETSIEDQARVCRARAETLGLGRAATGVLPLTPLSACSPMISDAEAACRRVGE
jgi:hypothetical protein